MTGAAPTPPARPRYSARVQLRRLLLGLRTLAGRGGGYFIPGRLVEPQHLSGERAYDAAEHLFAAAWPRMEAILADLANDPGPLEAIGHEAPPAPHWTQDWFPRLDAAVAYGLVRRLRPARIVEIGSGHSTRFLARAIRDGGLSTRLVAIDPRPRATLAGLAVEWIGKTLQSAGTEPFASLQPNDMLFIDSSHVMMPGSDVDHLFNRILPLLAPGVFVHVHDIFLPDAYPAEWAWRGYNEQQAVMGLLIAGGFDILFASRYAITRHADRARSGVLGRLPMPAGAHESSLWLVKRAAAIAPAHDR